MAERRDRRVAASLAGLKFLTHWHGHLCPWDLRRAPVRLGSLRPDADVTVFEIGLLVLEGYEDQLTVVYLSLMTHINDLVERHQQSERQTLVVTDEGHVILTHPLLAS